ncbi:hypothetical protein SAMN06265220_101265 [Flavobacterium nitrogenifigens]|uniref:Uncharacterized protein n=1 Tax=Flavobacterium nitrogenifigens TaxID=1617283 RepID=A0A521ALX3_9FLAO|nr:hypothetical protein SAMN06265220_101265 [Flavobacterium nitrogenifigens]
MKISKIILGTIIPIAITTLIVIGCLFINQIFFTEPNIACETYQLSNTTYLTYALIIIAFTSFYQIAIGNFILKQDKNSFVLGLLNSLTYALFYIGILILINLFQRKIEWDFFLIFFLLFFILGLLFTVSIKLWRKIIL